jgi:hypothetical protein
MADGQALISLNEIAKLMNTTYSRVSVAYRKAGVKPADRCGRKLLFSGDDLPAIKAVLDGMKTLKKADAQQPS